MSNPFLDVLHGWQNFYMLAGGASATLIGLMFIAISFSLNQTISERDISGARTYATPALIYFVSVLLSAVLMLIPTVSTISLGGLFFALGLGGAAFSLNVTYQLFRNRQTEYLSAWDWLWHTLLPPAAYLVMLGAAIWLLSGATSAFDLIAASAILLMLAGIRNSWDLAIWLASRR